METQLNCRSESITINFQFLIAFGSFNRKRKEKRREKNFQWIFNKLTLCALKGFWLRNSFKLMLMHITTEPQISFRFDYKFPEGSQCERSELLTNFHSAMTQNSISITQQSLLAQRASMHDCDPSRC